MAKRADDEYKDVKFYAENTKAKQAGFSKFQVDKDFYFCRYIDGKIAMLSQAYAGTAGRDNGIESVKKNEKIAKRFKFESRSGTGHGFSLKAGNGQEIAISPDYATLAQAQQVAGRLSGGTRSKNTTSKTSASRVKPKAKKVAPPKTTAAFTGTDGRVENYKPLSFYEKNGGQSDGFHSFDKDGAFYFHYNENDQVVLISESYTSKRGRDNGIASVTKNMKLTSAYEHHQHKNGKYYFDINAANKQEIATSRWYSSKARALSAAASLRGETPKPKKANVEQNYMPLAFYKKATKGQKEGFESFKGEDGEHYFTYFENSKIALISEGYPTAAIRDKGLASVKKNMKLENRYVYGKGADGKEGFILRAGNNKEIARSIGYGSAATAAAGAAYIIGTRKRAPKKTVKSAPSLAAGSVAVTGLAASGAAAKPKPVKTKAVKVKAPAQKPKPASKTAKPSKPLAAGAVAVAGLAASGAAAKPKPEKIKTTKVKAPAQKPKSAPKSSKSIKPLAAGTVAVTGLAATAASAKANAVKKAAVPVKAPPIKPAPPLDAKPVAAPLAAAASVAAAPIAVAAVGASAVAGAAALAAKPKAAKAEAGKAAAAAAVDASPVAAPIPAAAAAAGGGGSWGWLKWLLIGLLGLLALFFIFKACSVGGKTVRVAPEVSSSSATTNADASASLVTCWNGSKAKTDGACPTKITCWDGSFVTQQSACSAQPAAKEFECWDGSLEVEEAACPVKPVAKTKAGTTISSAPVTTTVANAASKMDAPSVDGRICGPSSQSLFNVTSSSPKSVSFLGSNPQFGNSLSLTPDGFYRKLSSAYQTSDRDRVFLDTLARSLGYTSFRNMDASMFSHDTLAYGTAGLLGFGSDHAVQFSALDVADPTHLEAFKVRSANGTDVHFMKRCGNYMYVCQP